jgi:hypothetical protein
MSDVIRLAKASKIKQFFSRMMDYGRYMETIESLSRSEKVL